MGLPASNDPGRGAAKPSIAVLPFQRIGALGRAETIAEGLPHEIIAALSRLRWLMVIARGSAFRFRGAEPDMRLVGQALGVRYCLSGCVERAPGGITVTVNLTETGDASVVWSERYATTAEDIHHIRSEITAAIVSALEIHVPLNEAWAARNTSSENLDAWSYYHLGLQHMYRFNRVDNARAADHFRSATRLDPEFSRAFAGLSFTSFQDAYLLYSDDAASAALMARRAAERSLELDPLDPFGHFTLGRSCWLQGNIEDSLGWLERAVALNPNYAQGHYALSWASTMLGDGAAGGAFVDTAMTLSPLDPFLYAMKGTRALSCLATGQLADATRWIDAAARTPGAHSVVNLVAAVIHAIAGEDTVAADWVGTARARNPTLSQSLFFQSMPFQDRQLRRKAEAALTRFGLH